MEDGKLTKDDLESIKIFAAAMAMQGLIASGKTKEDDMSDPWAYEDMAKLTAKRSIEYANALTEELKKELEK